jgi:hypothetical protein
MRTLSAVAAWNGEEFRCEGATLVDLSGGDAQETDPENLQTMIVLQDVTGPLPPLANTSKCCSAARHCSHSCIVQHFVGLIVCVRT